MRRDAAGSVVGYKERFAVRGFTQRPGVDYDEARALTPAKSTVHAIRALAAVRDMLIHCVDIKTACLNAMIDKALYVKQPERFLVGGKELVCHILCVIYGCKHRLDGCGAATMLLHW